MTGMLRATLRFLGRQSWAGTAAVIAICALLAAQAVNHLVETRLEVPPAATPALAPPPAPPEPPRSKDGTALTQRNMFCSTCDEVDRSSPPLVASATGTIPITSLPLRLVATNVTGGGDRSFASIVNGASHHQGAYGVGQSIPGVGAVQRIGSTSVDFYNEAAGRLERVSLLGPAEPAGSPPPMPGRAAAPPAGGLDDRIAAGVRKIDDNTYEVDRALLREIESDPSRIRGAQVAPAQQGGRMQGLRLLGVRPGSAFARIGLQSGDTIRGVNGFALDSPDAMLTAYTRMRELDNLTFSIERRGQKIDMHYRVR
jgi:general secretion pathway protein C